MSEMTLMERVVVAMRDALLDPAPGVDVDIRGDSDRLLRRLACAVLEAIREPSGTMLNAAEDKEARNPRATAGHMWRAMIDAALAEAAGQSSRIA